MGEPQNVAVRVYAGPSTVAPYAAVVFEVRAPRADALASERVIEMLATAAGSEMPTLTLPSGAVYFEQLIVPLFSALYSFAGPCDLPLEVGRSADGVCRIVAGYHDPHAAIEAMNSALKIAGLIYAQAESESDAPRAIAAALERTRAVMWARQPDPLACSLIRAAQARGVPVYQLAPMSRQWCYGQGSAGQTFFEVASERDSLTGARLAGNKFASNQVITRLGLPGVVHGIAQDAEQARGVAAQLGFPLVVKPVNSGKGRGVTVGVSNEEELANAFARAQKYTQLGVLIERPLAGDDHRLVVIGGQFRWAVQRRAPRVDGDGIHSVAELIAKKNATITDADVKSGYFARLEVDADMLGVLAKQGLLLEDRPSPGRSVRLRNIANVATGGSIIDCSESIHADNRALAETIARAFRLDAIGIDFMTTDITKSWRELRCAVLEVNATPGFSSDARAELIIAERFAPGRDGRVPSVVVLGDDGRLAARVAAVFERDGRRVGVTDATTTVLGGQARCAPSAELPVRVRALLLDPGCDALLISTTAAAVEAYGFPLDRCDLALLGPTAAVPPEVLSVLDACAGEVLDNAGPDGSLEVVEATLQRVLVARPRTTGR